MPVDTTVTVMLVAPSITWLLVRISPSAVSDDARAGGGGALVGEVGVDVDDADTQRCGGRRERRATRAVVAGWGVAAGGPLDDPIPGDPVPVDVLPFEGVAGNVGTGAGTNPAGGLDDEPLS